LVARQLPFTIVFFMALLILIVTNKVHTIAFKLTLPKKPFQVRSTCIFGSTVRLKMPKGGFPDSSRMSIIRSGFTPRLVIVIHVNLNLWRIWPLPGPASPLSEHPRLSIPCWLLPNKSPYSCQVANFTFKCITYEKGKGYACPVILHYRTSRLEEGREQGDLCGQEKRKVGVNFNPDCAVQ
jgi:hypothetical protein